MKSSVEIREWTWWCSRASCTTTQTQQSDDVPEGWVVVTTVTWEGHENVQEFCSQHCLHLYQDDAAEDFYDEQEPAWRRIAHNRVYHHELTAGCCSPQRQIQEGGLF